MGLAQAIPMHESTIMVETRSVPAHFPNGDDPEGYPAIEATGDWMVLADTKAADLLLVRPQSHAEPGDVVVSNMPCLGSTCKRLKRRSDGQFELSAESDTPCVPIIWLTASTLLAGWSARGRTSPSSSFHSEARA